MDIPAKFPITTINNGPMHGRTIITNSKMNQKVYSFLFCALLASTFAHELRAKGAAPVGFRYSRRLEKGAYPDICELSCTATETLNFTFGITVQAVEQVLILANLSSNAALAIDASNQIAVLLNGNTGAGVAINLSTLTGVYVSSGLWLASKATIDLYIRNLQGGLQALLSNPGALRFATKNVPKAIISEINRIVSRLVINYGLATAQDVTAGLRAVLPISTGILRLLKGNLSGLLALIGSEVIVIPLDIAALLNTLIGIETVIVKAYGSLEALVAAGVLLSWSALLGASNALILLADLLLGIGRNVDVGSALGPLLSSPQSALSLIALLGGNAHVGINGLLAVLSNLVGLADNSVIVEVFLNLLVQFVGNSGHYIKADLTQVLRDSLRGLLLVIERVDASSSLNELVVVISALIGGSWTYRGVTIGTIIFKLSAGVAAGGPKLLQLVVSVLVLLGHPLKVTIPTLTFILICNFNGAIGAWLLTVLGIGISSHIMVAVGGGLKAVLIGNKGINLDLLTRDLQQGLETIPGVAAVVRAVKGAYSTVATGGTAFKVLINTYPLFRTWILALIELCSGVKLKVPPKHLSTINILLGRLAGVSAHTGVSLAVYGSVNVKG
ncbi:hypothetical protein HUJ04_008908 [Dendroctonus ponderosae]|uniref:Uncharacterized protein n=1 Tax=Dendroctonus ponderosae TaxID=77166 RepID=A0AAR5PLE6_DENPD|nr:hypothetical protein HUJ04_008908 [Dendroctonus ponderosae]